MPASGKKSAWLSRKIILGTTLGAALVFMIIGVILWGGFNTAMEATNTLAFCISCHEMEENVYQEYKQTIHYTNPSGVRATCPDCHVPRSWIHKLARKIRASNELYHKLTGSVKTPEKFNARRLVLAEKVWQTMKSTNSRECRNCHSMEAMALGEQRPVAAERHAQAQEQGKTCIDCHKGIAHKLPEAFLEREHERFEREKVPCYDCHRDMARPSPGDDWD